MEEGRIGEELYIEAVQARLGLTQGLTAQATSDTLSESIANGILDGARRGEAIMDIFRNELKAQFAKTILTPAIKPAVEGINSLISAGLSGLGAALFPNALGGVY
ncbi:hypothetical protein RZS08_36665, partial [Arthrospira platensis SPKY1]|nr:hypothetical protein [Arthrospira platensis SPKY1]